MSDCEHMTLEELRRARDKAKADLRKMPNPDAGDFVCAIVISTGLAFVAILGAGFYCG